MPSQGFDLVALVTENPIFRSDVQEELLGSGRYSERRYLVSAIPLLLAEPFRKAGYFLNEVSEAGLNYNHNETTREDAIEYNHPFLKIYKGALIVIDGVGEDPFTIISPDSSASTGAEYMRVGLDYVKKNKLKSVELSTASVKFLDDIQTARGEFGQRILDFYRKNRCGATIKEFFK